MEVLCPHCQTKQVITPHSLLGKCFVCAYCKRIVRWQPDPKRPAARSGSAQASENSGANATENGANAPQIS